MTVGPQFDTLTVVQDDRIVWLTLNRPDKLNALNDTLLRELGEALDHIAALPEVRVVVLRGAGRAFCAGYDLSPDEGEIGYAEQRNPVQERDRLVGNIELFTRIWRHPVPVVAAIHGYCIGGGAQLATFADITVVTDDAVIMASPTLLIGGGYLSLLWSHLVGPKRAKLTSFDAGHRISGKVAAEWGWATQSVAPDQFDDHVAALARSIARTPANVLRMKKRGDQSRHRAAGLSHLCAHGSGDRCPAASVARDPRGTALDQGDRAARGDRSLLRRGPPDQTDLR